MKKIYLNTVLALAAAVSFTACDENDWNNRLDGFDEDQPFTDVRTVEYTLTDADYAAIASNSTNKALAGEDGKQALAAVGTRHAFSEQITARDYVPAFLASTSFAHFTATDGSSVKLTYNVAGALPEYLDQAAKAQRYELTDDNYINDVWESEDDNVLGFAPSHPASKYLAKILGNELEAEEGDYAVVTYKASTQEPVFGNVGGGDTPGFVPSETIGSVTLDADISCKGVITGICAQGYIVTDNSGSILVYVGKTFDPASVALGQQVEIDGTVSAYNKGFQIDGGSVAVNVVGTQAVTYPAPKVMSGADVDEAITRTDNALAQYVRIKGVASVSNYINIAIDGATKAQGSLYQGTAEQKALFTDKAEVTVDGYFVSISGGKYFNMIVTAVNGKQLARPLRTSLRTAAAAEVPMETYNALYKFSGGRWTQPTGFTVLNPADYKAMGQSYNNLSNPAAYLPTYLKTTFPYAQADDVKDVMYVYYDSKAKESYYLCDEYKFDGNAWTLNTGITVETAQFVRNGGKWMYDPCVTITLPSGKGQELSQKYYQACVDWVFENVCKPLGDTDIKSGKTYISSYGNNEYYSGTSAYQGNVDLRASAAKAQYPTEYGDMTDEAVVALEKSRFMNEVMPGALAKLHADAAPIDGLDVIYTINFTVYDNSSKQYTARFRVVAPGKFEPIDCTWDEEE